MTNIATGEAMPKTMNDLLAKVRKLEEVVNSRTHDDDDMDGELERLDRMIKSYSVDTPEDAIALLQYVVRTGGLHSAIQPLVESVATWIQNSHPAVIGAAGQVAA